MHMLLSFISPSSYNVNISVFNTQDITHHKNNHSALLINNITMKKGRKGKDFRKKFAMFFH